MADGCRQENHANAGLELGAFIGAAVRDGRDKLTVALLASACVTWPVDRAAHRGEHRQTRHGRAAGRGRTMGRSGDYGQDRAFVGDRHRSRRARPRQLKAIEAAGHPVLRLTDADRRPWRGVLSMGIRDRGCRARCSASIHSMSQTWRRPRRRPKRSSACTRLNGRLPQPAAAAEDGAVAVFSNKFSGDVPADVVRSALGRLAAGDYVAFLSYLPADSDARPAIADIRRAIRSRAHTAEHVWRGPAIPPLHRAVPQGRAKHGANPKALRLGEQTGAVVEARLKRTPSLASRSRFGDLTSLSPKQPRACRCPRRGDQPEDIGAIVGPGADSGARNRPAARRLARMFSWGVDRTPTEYSLKLLIILFHGFNSKTRHSRSEVIGGTTPATKRWACQECPFAFPSNMPFDRRCWAPVHMGIFLRKRVPGIRTSFSKR